MNTLNMLKELYEDMLSQFPLKSRQLGSQTVERKQDTDLHKQGEKHVSPDIFYSPFKNIVSVMSHYIPQKCLISPPFASRVIVSSMDLIYIAITNLSV